MHGNHHYLQGTLIREKSMNVKHFFDPDTATFTYIVSDPATHKCAIIDSVLNYDQDAGKTSEDSINKVIAYIADEKLEVEWILETHAHADHLTGSHILKEKYGAKTGIGEHIKEVAKFWVPLFNTEHDTPLDCKQFDHLFEDGETFKIGSLDVKVMHTPGHTPACSCYIIGDSIFVGDTIFMPYVGTARTDFPGGCARDMYHSVQKILALPDATKIYTCHDYPLEGNEPKCISTVAEQKSTNSMVHDGVTEDEYVTARNCKNINNNIIQTKNDIIIYQKVIDYFNNNIQYVKIPLNKL